MPSHSPLVGVISWEAPRNDFARRAVARASGEPEVGPFQGLQGAEATAAEMAPSLRSALSHVYRERGVSEISLRHTLDRIGTSLKRYDNAWRIFYAMATVRGYSVDSTLEQLISVWSDLGVKSVHQARNAYSACVLFPQLEAIAHHPIVRKLKQQWNVSVPRYAAFYDAFDVFCKLMSRHTYDPSSVENIRLRLIISWRFLGLFQSVDLARAYRVVAVQNGQHMVTVRRKNQKHAKLECVMTLADESISPWHLYCLYIKLTPYAPPGSPLLRASKAPYSPICADTVGSLTRDALISVGVPKGYAAHSTRGSGLAMYSSWELPPEVTAELGQWGSLDAFQKYHLRLHAVSKASRVVNERLSIPTDVQRASLGSGALPEPSRSLPRDDRGRREGKGNAQDTRDPPAPPVVVESSGDGPSRRVGKRQRPLLLPYAPIAARLRSRRPTVSPPPKRRRLHPPLPVHLQPQGAQRVPASPYTIPTRVSRTRSGRQVSGFVFRVNDLSTDSS